MKRNFAKEHLVQWFLLLLFMGTNVKTVSFRGILTYELATMRKIQSADVPQEEQLAEFYSKRTLLLKYGLPITLLKF